MALDTKQVIEAICAHPETGDHEVLGDLRLSELAAWLGERSEKKIKRYAHDLGIDTSAMQLWVSATARYGYLHKDTPPSPVVFQEPNYGSSAVA